MLCACLLSSRSERYGFKGWPSHRVASSDDRAGQPRPEPGYGLAIDASQRRERITAVAKPCQGAPNCRGENTQPSARAGAFPNRTERRRQAIEDTGTGGTRGRGFPASSRAWPPRAPARGGAVGAVSSSQRSADPPAGRRACDRSARRCRAEGRPVTPGWTPHALRERHPESIRTRRRIATEPLAHARCEIRPLDRSA